MKRSSYRDRDYSFGQAMLTLRSAIGLTQTGLADYLGVSRRAVGDWEAGGSYPKVENLRQFIALAVQHKAFPAGREADEIRSLWKAARQKVLLDEAWLTALLAGDQQAGHAFMSLRHVDDWNRAKETRAPASHNLPVQSTPFIGRSGELTEIARILTDSPCRLLTLLGPGGIGKTRLGIQAASSQSGIFRDGVTFVPLASIGTASQIVSAVGEALNLPFAGQSNPKTHLLSTLRERHMLLLLDNFEHVLEGAELVHEIIHRAPDVTVLVTSRVRLNLQAEWLFDVEGLSYPQTIPPALTDISGYSAVELFIQRAAQVQPTFQTSPLAMAAVARICETVAGIPLALELAAAGVRTLSVSEIEEQMRANLDALSTSLRDVPARHRSIRAAFDHSWNLLTEPERALFTRLSVFRGGCTVEAAGQVTGANLPALLTLVDKSLLRQMLVSDTPDPRFFMLEPLREYALEKLAIRGETNALQHAHAACYLQLAQAAAAQWGTPMIEAWIGPFHREMDNMRAALQWALDSGDSIIGLQLADALWKFWRSYGYIGEGRVWLEQLLALNEQNPGSTELTARRRGLYAAAWLASDQHDYARAEQLFEQSMALRRALGETEGETDLLLNAARQARAEGHYKRATVLLEDALARHRALGDRATLNNADLEHSLSEFGQILRELGLVLREQGRFERAATLFQEGLELHRAMGDRASIALSLLGLADVGRDQADVVWVHEYGEESLAILRELGMQWAIGFSLNTLAQAAYADGDITRAFALADESVALFRDLQADGSIAEVLVTLGHILRVQQELSAAQDAFTESLRLALVVGPRLLVAAALEGLASVMAYAQQEALAVQLLSAAAVLRGQMHTPVRPADQATLNNAIAAARAALGTLHFETLWSEAQHEPLEQILSLIPGIAALDEPLLEPLAPLPVKPVSPTSSTISSPALPAYRTDWDDAVTVPAFYGREEEMKLLTEWLIEERCRVVSVLGIGGIGKSALTVTLMQQVAPHFDMVIWRSLRDIPGSDAFLDDLLHVFAPQAQGQTPAAFERRISLLLEHMRANRILLVLDNLESVLEDGEGAGLMLPGYEGFGRFLRRSAETEHRSCVLLTSREKPNDLVPLEGSRAPVRALRLTRLDTDSSEKLVAERGVVGTPDDHVRLVEAYAGNPLALKIVAQTIVDLFDGEIASFLEQGEVIFGSIRELLNEHFVRLSALEQRVLLWLAIVREPATLDELLALQAASIPRVRLLEAVEALRRRSLIERGKQTGSVTLQSVVLEYMTARIITEASDEIRSGELSNIMIEHGFELAQADEYVREIQHRLIVLPILEHLRSAYSQQAALETQLLTLLDSLKMCDESAQGYAPTNLVMLLRSLRGSLRGLDLSHLVLRSAYLQGVEMQDARLSETFIQGTVFTETFDAVTAVATSPTYWATGSRRGEIRLWTAGGLVLQRGWRAHGDIIVDLAFSPDGRALASTGSWDGTVKVWDAASGALLWSARHLSQAYTVLFSPDGSIIASTGYDAIVRLWDRQTGTSLQELHHPDTVCGIAWSPDGRILATGDLKGVIRFWQISQTEPAACILTLEAHSNCVEGLAFNPDGKTLASGSWDNTVKLWDVAAQRLLHTLTAFTDRVIGVAWSPDGRILATAGREPTIWLWDAHQNNYYAALRGHTAGIYGIAFTPDSQILLSGSEDSTLRVWGIASASCIRFLQGYAASLYDLDWSPDGSHIVTGGSDALVTVFALSGETALKTLPGHHGFVIGTGWSANRRWLASSEWNNTVRLWDAASGESVKILHNPDPAGDYFDRLAWSPREQRLAMATLTHGVQIFEMASQRQHFIGGQVSTWIRHVAWSPDGVYLAGGGADGSVYIWNTVEDTLIQQLPGHHSSVIDLAWSPDGTQLVSSSRGIQGGEVFVWDVQHSQRVCTLEGHPTIVYAVVWTPDTNLLVTADGDGMMRWWDIERKECIRTLEAHQGTIHSLRRSPDGTKLASCANDGAIMLWDIHTGKHLQTLRRDRPYERLNITGIRGLTEAQKVTLRTLGAVEDT